MLNVTRLKVKHYLNSEETWPSRPMVRPATMLNTRLLHVRPSANILPSRQSSVIASPILPILKSGYMGFACLEYYADAIPALTMYATAGWSPVAGGLPARRIALAGNYSKIGIVLT